MKSYGIRNGVRPTITTAEEGTIALVAGDKGAIFYNTDTDSLRTWDGSAFQNVGGSGGEKDFVATGTIGAGAAVGLRSDGTVEIIEDTVAPGGFGTGVTFDTNPIRTATCYDSTNNRVVVIYYTNSNPAYVYSKVGVVSGGTITFGAKTLVISNEVTDIAVAYDSTNDAVVLVYSGRLITDHHAIIGRVDISAETCSFGTAVAYSTNQTDQAGVCYDSISNRIVIAYRDRNSQNWGRAVVGEVNGVAKTISFGAYVTYASGVSSYYNNPISISSGNKVVIAYQGTSGSAVVGTIVPSTNSITFGTPVVFQSGGASWIDIVFDSASNQVVIAYSNGSNSSYGTAVVGAVSGTSISFGTPSVFLSSSTITFTMVYSVINAKIVIATRDPSDSNYGRSIIGTVSGTGISFDSPTTFSNYYFNRPSSAYDSISGKAVISYSTNNSSGETAVYTLDEITTNVASTIGINTTAKVNAETATVTILAGTSGGHSALVIGDI